MVRSQAVGTQRWVRTFGTSGIERVHDFSLQAGPGCERSEDGLVETYWGDETQGGRRKYYRITDSGRAVFRKNVRDWAATQHIINTLLNVKGTRS